LTSARFFAAAVVVLYHYHKELSPLKPDGSATPFRELLDRGFLGVTFFFVLSGYILSLNYLDKFRSGSADIKSFFVARFARIYPLYLASVVVCIPYVFFDPSKIPHGNDIVNLRNNPLSAGVMYLLGAESHWPDGVGRLTVLPSWSISTEFFFYLLFPFFATIVSRLSRNASKILLVLVGMWALAYALMFHFVSLSRVLFFMDPDRVQIINDFIFQRPVSGIHANWPLFAVGMLTFKAFEGDLSPVFQKWLPKLFAFFLVVNPLWYILQPPELKTELFFVTKFFDALPLCILGIFWLHKGTGAIHAWLGNNRLVLLGEISFALYLVHSPIRLAGRFLLAKPLGIQETSPLFYVPLWALSLVISWLAWKYIEVPARGAILSSWKRRQTAKQPASV
jgi:peptidoglycan/LPS O-acetylase OafA/YrhL